MGNGSRIGIVAALEREVRPLIRTWRVREADHEGRRFRFFENGDAVLVCGGMGAVAARRAAEAMIATYQPGVIYSAGFAGALDPGLKVGEVIEPRRVVDASDGSSISLESGEGVLVTFGSVASPAQKAKLRNSFAAQAVDMEAAAVARAAQAQGVAFAAVKAISDDFEFDFPPLERFVDPDGRFKEGGFSAFAVLRPWLWPHVSQMARNSRKASSALCRRLESLVLKPSPASSDQEVVSRR